jgi:hypothetical protein
MKAVVSVWIRELGNFGSIFTKFRYKMPSQNLLADKNTQRKRTELFFPEQAMKNQRGSTGTAQFFL